jgi:hypothetical protein
MAARRNDLATGRPARLRRLQSSPGRRSRCICQGAGCRLDSDCEACATEPCLKDWNKSPAHSEAYLPARVLVALAVVSYALILGAGSLRTVDRLIAGNGSYGCSGHTAGGMLPSWGGVQ